MHGPAALHGEHSRRDTINRSASLAVSSSKQKAAMQAPQAKQGSIIVVPRTVIDYSLWLRRGPHAISSHAKFSSGQLALRWLANAQLAGFPTVFRSRQNKSSVARSFPFTRAPGPCIGR
jgi:hypothetical protein